MKYSELPQEAREQLESNKASFIESNTCNNSYRVQLISENGTRYFVATRHQSSWNDNKGNYLPFGGGSTWTITYGAIQFQRVKNPVGGYDYEWCLGKMFGKSANGTEIPKELKTKKEVIELVNKIGIF